MLVLTLDYNQVFRFMNEFGIDYLNRFNELIIDEQHNIYTTLNHCQDIKDVETSVVYALCRPIGKGLSTGHAKRLLKKINKYFKVDLTVEDMRQLYVSMCYLNKFDEFKSFISRGFPMSELD